MEVATPRSQGHGNKLESITATQGAIMMPRSASTQLKSPHWKYGNLYPQLEGLRRSIGFHFAYPMNRPEAWKSKTPAQGAVAQNGTLGVHHPNFIRHTQSFRAISQAQGATEMRNS